jgi:hypothetical protein
MECGELRGARLLCACGAIALFALPNGDARIVQRGSDGRAWVLLRLRRRDAGEGAEYALDARM